MLLQESLEPVALKDFNEHRQAQDEAPHAVHPADVAFPDPVAAVGREAFLGHQELFHQKVLGYVVQPELDVGGCTAELVLRPPKLVMVEMS